MIELAGGAIAIGFFTNLLYDIVKAVPNINKDSIEKYFDKQSINVNDKQVEQIVEVIKEIKLKAKAEVLDKQDFIQSIENDKDIKQVVENINQTYIENQTNIDSQTNIQNQTNLKDNSRYVDTGGGKYVEGDNNEIHHHYSKEDKPKK